MFKGIIFLFDMLLILLLQQDLFPFNGARWFVSNIVDYTIYCTFDRIGNSSAYFLSADEIRIKKSDKTSTALGQVKFQDDELMFVGDKAIVKKQADTTYTTLSQVQFHYPDSKINGQAQQVNNDGTNKSLMKLVTLYVH